MLDANGRTLDFDRAGAIIAGIDLGGFNPGIFTVTNSLSIGSIGNGGGVAAVEIAAGQDLTLKGTPTVGAGVAANTYTGLGAITLDDARLIIDADIGLTGNIHSKAGVGYIEINGNKNVILTGAIGTLQPIKQLKRGANAN